MSESRMHMDFVNMVFNYVCTLVPECSRSFIEIDSPDSQKKPDRTIDNFVPDVLFDAGSSLIIGEAKTPDDVDRDHSVSQYKSYLNACKMNSGFSCLVLGVSWDTFIAAKNLIRKLKKEMDSSTQVFVVCENGMVCEI
jgi:hypothetical protein